LVPFGEISERCVKETGNDNDSLLNRPEKSTLISEEDASMTYALALVLIWETMVPKWLSGEMIKWERDYAAAKTTALCERKPLAVVVGSEAKGWKQLISDGRWDATVARVLSDGYVAVYLDQKDESDRELIAALGLTEHPGLVLSDRGGSVMAYRHVGPLNAADLVAQLRRFAASHLVVQTTQGHGPPAAVTQGVAPATFYGRFDAATCHT
jgi:hypothetical protein